MPTREVPSLADLDPRELGSGATPTPGLRVLIAEDTASQRLILTKQVAALGYEVVTAVDGEDALAKVEQHRPHILLTDWVMPKVDGIGVCKVTRASDAGNLIYIIMLTAHGDEDHLVEAFDAGADDYVSKPIQPGELDARLRAGKRVVELQVALCREAENLKNVNAAIEERSREVFLAHEKLQAAATFLHDVYRAMPGALLVLDRKGIMEAVNDSAAPMLGYSVDELVGSSLAKIIDPDDPVNIAGLEALASNGAILRTEKTCITKTGARVGSRVVFSECAWRVGQRRRTARVRLYRARHRRPQTTGAGATTSAEAGVGGSPGLGSASITRTSGINFLPIVKNVEPAHRYVSRSSS